MSDADDLPPENWWRKNEIGIDEGAEDNDNLLPEQHCHCIASTIRLGGVVISTVKLREIASFITRVLVTTSVRETEHDVDDNDDDAEDDLEYDTEDGD